MNRRPPGLLLSRCITGFLQYKMAEGLRPRTIDSYRRRLESWVAYAGDVQVESLTTRDLRAYLAWLRTEYKPRRTSGDVRPLSPKTIRNAWVVLSSFFTWATTEFDMPNPMDGVPAPRFEVPHVEPFSKEEVLELLKACKYCRESYPSNRRRFTTRRPTARRDEAIILVLLDTGLRATELCSLMIGDLDPRTGRVEVKHGAAGGAKGGRGRAVFLGRSARRSLWRYLAEREDGEDPDAPIFLGVHERPLNKNALRRMIARLGEKTGIRKCYPHRFRHTFAITYLRSGGDVFTLQSLLGHSSLDMVQRYARIAEVDVAKAHRKASPADNWRL